MKNTPKYALVTLAIGEFYEEMAKSTHPLMERYAAKVNAEFIVISEPIIALKTGLPTKYEKFQLYDLFEIYDRILFVDTDIVILPNAPDVFNVVDPEHFGAVSEESFSGASLEKRVTQEQLGELDWIRPYINSGVMVIPKSARDLFDYNRTTLIHWAVGDFRKNHPTLLNDQPYLSYHINKLHIKFQELSYRFNHTRAMPNSHKRFTSFFIHYSGGSGHRYGTRLNQIHLDSKLAHNVFFRTLSRILPAYRWVADRLNFAFVNYLFDKRT